MPTIAVAAENGIPWEAVTAVLAKAAMFGLVVRIFLILRRLLK
jgi:hypothetical protein